MPIHPRFFKSKNAGTSLIEFALALPILTVILVGTVEFGRYAIVNQKLDKIAKSMADFATQADDHQLTNDELAIYSHAAQAIMAPFAFNSSTNATVIFSTIETTTSLHPDPVNTFCNPPPGGSMGIINCISSRSTPIGADASTTASRIGTVGNSAELPGGYQVAPDQAVIVAEIFNTYQPLLQLFTEFLPPQPTYKEAVFKPRYPIPFPSPAPAPAPAPTPTPTPAPTPTPTPTPAPTPTPTPTPDATPDHAPDTAPDNAPDGVSHPDGTPPDGVSNPDPSPDGVSHPDPAPDSVPKPAPKPKPHPRPV